MPVVSLEDTIVVFYRQRVRALRSAISCKVTLVLFITIELFSSLGFQMDKVLSTLMKRYSSLLHIVSMATSASAQVESVLGSCV